MSVLFLGQNINFFVGMAAFLVFHHCRPVVCKMYMALGTILLIGCFFFEVQTGKELLHSSLIYAFAFGGILIGAVMAEAVSGRKYPRFFSFVGDSSYSIYLLHLAFQGVLLKCVFKLSLPKLIGNELTYLLVLSGSVGLGCIAYQFCEKPLLKLIRAKLEDRKQPLLKMQASC